MNYLFFLNMLLFLCIPAECYSIRKELSLNDLINYICNYSDDYKIYEMKKEIIDRQYASDIHSYEYSLSFSLQPQFNHSISPITQPNGSIVNHNLSNYSASPTINFSKPIIFLGGTISATSNLNYYKTISPSSYSQNFSTNLFHISYSQPIQMHNSMKWGRKSARASFWLNKYDNVSDYINLKSKTCHIYFEVVKNRLLLKQYQEQLTHLDSIEIVYNNLYKHGHIIKIELEELRISKLELIDKIKYCKSNLSYSTSELNSLVNNYLNIDSFLLKIPHDFKLLDYSTVYNILKKKQIEYEKVSRIPIKRGLIESKNAKGIQLSLAAGVGVNSSSDTFSKLWDKKIPTFNISLNAKIPISDLKEKNNQYKMAELQLRQFEISQRNRKESEIYSLTNIVQQYNNLISSLALAEEKTTFLYEEVQIKEILLLSRKILFDEYYKTTKKIIENEINKVTYTKELYDCIFHLESLTMHDFSTRNDFYEIY